MDDPPPTAPAAIDQSFLAQVHHLEDDISRQLCCEVGLDITFVAYLRLMSRFGFFTFGPVTVDVRMLEDILARTTVPTPGWEPPAKFGDDYIRFSRALMDEVRRSGRTRVDELHVLLTFMRFGEGLPARVFGELGVTPEQVELYARSLGQHGTMEPLYSPEEAAAYLGVHVQTVRSWIRSGRLPASRLAGQRALRIRASDLSRVLEPVSADDFNDTERGE